MKTKRVRGRGRKHHYFLRESGNKDRKVADRPPEYRPARVVAPEQLDTYEQRDPMEV
jgi:hypothetical protein